MASSTSVAARTAGVTLVAALAVAGCGGRTADKAGGQRRARPLVLTLANYNFDTRELDPFAREVEKRSHRTIRIAFRNAWRWRLGLAERNLETKLVGDVKAGRADLGWVGTRAWDALGVTSLDALHAPLLIDSYTLEQAVLQSRIPDQMLARLRTIGLVGLGILPGPERWPIGLAKPLVDTADFRGLRIGTSAARLAHRTVRALGGIPVTFKHGPTNGPSLAGLDGLEFPLSGFDENKYDLQARFVTANVALWPRPLVLFTTRATYNRLTPVQRQILREAVRAAIPATVRVEKKLDREAVSALCERGHVELVRASPSDLARFRAVAGRVLATLDSESRAYVTAIERIRARLRAHAKTTVSCPANRVTVSGAIPDGTYESTMTAADGRRAKIPAGDSFYKNLPIHHILVIHGRNYVLYDVFPDGHREPSQEGTYSTYRGRVQFTYAGETLLPFSWSFDGHRLRFFDLPFHGSGYYGATFSPPWTKIA